jgi:DNA adenine methylase
MININGYGSVKPLLKWAGGKRQIINELFKRIPKKFNFYYEPFAGGASFLIHLYNNNLIKYGTISDLNGELINFYNVIKYNLNEFLEEEKKDNLPNNIEYYNLRDEYNNIIGDNNYKIRRAVLFLYFNKHAYNGLWRVNSNNKFNVPFGKYKNVNMFDYNNIYNFNIMLKNINILNSDFEAVVKETKENDFVYFDPPYEPLNKTSYFTGYTKNGFDYNEQERLFKVFKGLADKNVNVMLSNSYNEKMLELYNEFNIDIVNVSRFINSDASKRTGLKEIIVTSY